MVLRSKQRIQRFLFVQFLSWALIFGLTSAGYLHFFRYYLLKLQWKHTIKHQVLKNISKDQLVLWKFALQEKPPVHFESGYDEFEYQGVMYDVVWTEVQQDTVYYWCWLDYEETSLNQQIAQLLASTLDHYEDEAFMKWFKKLYFAVPAVSLASLPKTIVPIHPKTLFYSGSFRPENGHPPES